jgi:4-aminobutyrate aminotransferase
MKTARRPNMKTALPGPKAAALIARDARAMSPSFTRAYPFVMEQGEGCWVTDVDGNTFLDFTAGIAVVTTGHSHPRVVAAIEEQAKHFLHMSGTDFYYRSEIELAERLEAKILPGTPAKVFFTNSGAEAIEGAMKLARYATGRPSYIAFIGGFHGRTFGALSLTASKASQRRRFAPLLSSVFHAPFPSASRGVTRSCSTLSPPPRAWRRSSSNRSRVRAGTWCRPTISCLGCAS